MNIKEFLTDIILKVLTDKEKLRYLAEVFKNVHKHNYSLDFDNRQLIFKSIKEIFDELIFYKADLDFLRQFNINVDEIITYTDFIFMIEDFVPVIKEEYENEILDGVLSATMLGLALKVERDISILYEILNEKGLLF